MVFVKLLEVVWGNSVFWPCILSKEVSAHDRLTWGETTSEKASLQKEWKAKICIYSTLVRGLFFVN